MAFDYKRFFVVYAMKNLFFCQFDHLKPRLSEKLKNLCPYKLRILKKNVYFAEKNDNAKFGVAAPFFERKNLCNRKI
jgi:hypothetical protein